MNSHRNLTPGPAFLANLWHTRAPPAVLTT